MAGTSMETLSLLRMRMVLGEGLRLSGGEGVEGWRPEERGVVEVMGVPGVVDTTGMEHRRRAHREDMARPVDEEDTDHRQEGATARRREDTALVCAEDGLLLQATKDRRDRTTKTALPTIPRVLPVHIVRDSPLQDRPRLLGTA
jgi:hypothetical protein